MLPMKSLFRASTIRLITPNYIIPEVIMSKYRVHAGFQIMRCSMVTMQVDAPRGF